jgi:hypothetical protein
LALGGAHANFLRAPASNSNLGAGGGECGFLGFSALQADELLTFEAVGFGTFKGDLMLDGAACSGVFTTSSWVRKRTAFWR